MTEQFKTNKTLPFQERLASGKRELPIDQSVVGTNLDEQRRILEGLVSGSKRKASDAQNLDVSNNPTPAP